MSLSTKFLEHSLRLGRRLTTTAQNASAGVEKASGAAANFGVSQTDAAELQLLLVSRIEFHVFYPMFLFIHA